MKRLLSTVVLAGALFAGEARADEPFVVLRDDDGSIEASPMQTNAQVAKVRDRVKDLYVASGQPIPEIMSVWTTFPLGGNPNGTLFLGYANDVTGIGLEQFYPGDGTFAYEPKPLRSILLHNDALVIDKRAAHHHAPVEGYATYLFLLELSHNWGPALRVPDPNPGDLVGFPFHWSYYMDAGGSISGGNVWKDNSDGTFDIVPAKPSELGYSMLDLYIQGLAAPEEVPPFKVLTDVQFSGTPPTDPLWGGAVAPHSFPWFDASTPVTVQATARDLTIDDVVAANGERAPVSGTKTSFTLGIVLVESKDTGDADAAAHCTTFSEIAGSLAPAYAKATAQRETLEVVTSSLPDGCAGPGGTGGAGGATGGGGTGGSTGTTQSGGAGGGDSGETDDSGCACSTPGGGGTSGDSLPPVHVAALLSGAILAGRWGRRRRRALSG